jgi:hypothetical protein
MPSAYEALQRLKAAQKVRREAKEKWDAAFDQFLEDSQRPLGLRDLMFALAVIARIVDRALESYKETSLPLTSGLNSDIGGAPRSRDRNRAQMKVFETLFHEVTRKVGFLPDNHCADLFRTRE